MKTRKLGKEGLEVSEMGLGCMTIGKDYTDSDRASAIDIIHRAYDLGVTMFDTAELYGGILGRNEELVGNAIKPFRDNIVIATKCGVRFEEGNMIMNSSRERIKESVESSLTRLGTDHIDLYYTHRVDLSVPIEEVALTMKGLHEEGKIKYWGISEPSMETLRKANAVFPVSVIESEYNMMWREPEQAIFPTLEELDIGLVPYRPLARGFLSDRYEGMYLEAAKNTRFDENNLAKNNQLKVELIDLAKKKGMSAAQLALSWLLAKKPYIVPIPGTSNMQRMEENTTSVNFTLTEDEVKKIDEMLDKIEIAGERYDPNSQNGQSVRK